MKFNELRDWTYVNTSRKLIKKGQTKRAWEFIKHTVQMRIKEARRMEFPICDFHVKLGDSLESYKFYVGFDFIEDIFEDMFDSENTENSFIFSPILIPVDMDNFTRYYNQLKDNGSSGYNYLGGFIGGTMFNIYFKIEDYKLKFTTFDFFTIDKGDTGDIKLSNRQSAGKFKNHLLKLIKDENSELHQSLMDVIVNHLGSDYGFEIDDIINRIKKISSNDIFEEI